MQTKFYSSEKIFTGTEWLSDVIIEVKDGTVMALLPKANIHAEQVENCHGILAPAFIDIQLYGAYDRLLSVFPEPQTLSLINAYCKSGGTILCLPTLATNTKEIFFKSIDAVRTYWANGGEGVWGLHLEGPWLNREKRGAHVEALIHAPTLEEVQELLDYGKGIIKMITIAPEVCSREVVELLLSHQIILSAGHSNASFHEATEAFDNGMTAVTHLYNAMSAFQHRSPGLVGATLLHSGVRASIIADGHHVDYEAIKIAKMLMGERLFAITDAVTTTSSGVYQHQLVGDKYECNGKLSGSALTQYHSLINLVKYVGIELGEALRMCSLYPAQVIRADHRYGKIAPGYSAQWVHLSDTLNFEGLLLDCS
jgi:N-acetylglucosamine-6-phosphate deacetylase